MTAHRVILDNEAATAQFGADIAMALQPGDLICLKGEIGAGKSTLARALIRHLADDWELEVPSPTYTLCQIYELDLPIAHYDLYRLSADEELHELGLDDNLAEGAVVLEWPERAGDIIPAFALTVEMLSSEEGGRTAVLHENPEASDLTERLVRSLAIRRFLDQEWGEGAKRTFLQGDASARRYEVASLEGEERILMDAPRQPDGPPIRDGLPYSRIAHLAEDVLPFVAVADTLRQRGFATPSIHARDFDQGLLLTEHLGMGRIVDVQNRPVRERYLAAAGLLARLHSQDWPREVSVEEGKENRITYRIPPYDRNALMIEASLFADWYAPSHKGNALLESERKRFDLIWDRLVSVVEHSMPTLVLRDYHSPNLIWRENMNFPKNLGLIDFQDAVIGPQAYDLASLAQDARVDISRTLENSIVETYLNERSEQSDFSVEAFRRDYAILAALRATKILGIFVRLNERDGKPAYLRHLPRMRDYLARSLCAPVLEDYAAWCIEVAGIQKTPPAKEWL